MSYLSAAHNVYRKLEETDFKKILGGYLKDYDKVFASLEKKFGFDELRKSYAEDIQLTTNNYLPFFKEELKKFFQIKEVTYYQNNLPLRTLSLLMWVWEKKLDLSEKSLQKFIDSLFLGTFGYKMLDISFDNKNYHSEVSLVGFYSIRLAEQLLTEVLGLENTSEPIAKYFSMYFETELFEKRNRWKGCPFSWDEVEKLGNKSAPIYTIYESLFKYTGYSYKKIREINASLQYVSAVIQLIDDLADAKQDLSNGYETLVMSGYYKTFGINSEITDERINQTLSQERLKMIYITGQNLLDKARKLFEKNDEFVIQLNVELFNLNFVTLFHTT